MEYLLVSLSALCVGVQFNINKLYTRRTPSNIYATLAFPMLTMGIASLAFFFVNGCSLHFTGFGAVMSVFAAVVNAVTLVVGVLATGRGRVSVYTTFMMLGGMLLPYLFGLIFLDEALTWGKIVGIVVLIGALMVSIIPSKAERAATQKGANTLFVLLCACAFVLNGFNSIIGKVHQTGENAMGTFDFTIFNFALQFVIMALSMLAVYAVKKIKSCKMQGDAPLQNASDTAGKAFVLNRKSVLVILAICAAFAIVSGTGALLNLTAAKTMPASISYPFISGGSTVFGTLIAAIMYKEKIDLLTAVSLVLTLAGTILFIF